MWELACCSVSVENGSSALDLEEIDGQWDYERWKVRMKGRLYGRC